MNASTDVALTSAGGWPSVFGAVALVLLFLVWIIPGSIMVLRETSLDKPNRIPQFYGYTVCLIALVIGLLSIASLIDSVFARMSPLQGASTYGQSLRSFEAFQATRATTPTFGRETPATPDTASEATLRARYDALVADKMESVRFDSSKTIVTEGLFLLIAIGLFGYHWRWMRRLGVPPGAG